MLQTQPKIDGHNFEVQFAGEYLAFRKQELKYCITNISNGLFSYSDIHLIFEL